MDEALDFLSDSSLACINTDDRPGDEVLRSDQARGLMKELMESLNDEMGDRDNLAEASKPLLWWIRRCGTSPMLTTRTLRLGN